MPRSTQVTDSQPEAPRSRKGAATRARLVESAKEEFEETGFLETRISDIAKRAGMSHGTFYHYFDSKEQIFREVAEAQEALLTAPDDGDEPAADATEFDRILRANRRYLERYRANGRIMGVIEEVSRYDTLRERGTHASARSTSPSGPRPRCDGSRPRASPIATSIRRSPPSHSDR